MKYKGPERRKGPDMVVRTIHTISNLSMLINVALVLLFSFANPRMETMFDRFAGQSLSGRWNKELIFYIMVLLVLQLAISILGIIMNASRHHRRKDQYRVALFISFSISIIGLFIISL